MAQSQQLISKLLQAEEEADKIIQAARDMRQAKMRDVKESAEAELAPFRMKEEQKFAEESRAMAAKGNISAELDRQTASELSGVNSQYENNKKNAIKFILDKVLDIDCAVPESVKAMLVVA